MPETLSIGSLPSVFSPLAKALLDGFSEGVVVFDAEGKLLYANLQAREALAGMDLADACVVRMSELIEGSTVYTVDRTDFSVYRAHGNRPIRCLFPR